jgi:uroporphyrinogen decarboxylase
MRGGRDQGEGGSMSGNRERVLASLHHQQPDRIPYDVRFTQKAHARMAEFYGDPAFSLKLGNCLTWLGCEPEDGWKQVEPDIWEDQFGVRWDRSIDKDIGNVCNQLVTPENLRDYRFPDPDDPSRYGGYEKALDPREDRFLLVNFGFSLFERAWTLAGMENLLMAMGDDRRFAHQLLDRILEFDLRVIENACSFDVDAMIFGDDWGMQTGLIMGPRAWGEFIAPRIRQMYGLVRSRGKLVFIHSCGKVDRVFPELIECGVDVFNPFQPEVMDVFEVKRRYGADLCFFGGVSVQRTLPHGTVAEVREEARRLLEVVGRDGGYIAAPSHWIPADSKPENVAALIEVLQSQ